MARYLMYLRKSRLDTDYEEVSVEETLSRHRTILDQLCAEKKDPLAQRTREESGQGRFPCEDPYPEQ